MGEDMSTTSNKRGSGSRRKGQSTSSGRSRQANSSSAGQNIRRNTAQKARRNTKRRRKPTHDYKMIAIVGVVLILVITGVVFATKHFKNKETAGAGSTEETELETELAKNVSVDGISITGMSRNAARDEILKHYAWEMKVTYEDAENAYEVSNLLEGRVQELLEEIYQGEPKESYVLDISGLEGEVQAEVAAIAKQWDIQAQNGAIAGFDKATGSFQYSGEKTGKLIDQEALKKDMQTALAGKQFNAVLTAKGVSVAPEITEEQAKALYTTIGSMSTKTTNNKDRNTNIQIAADALDGLIVQPGQEFSFNQTTGNRTVEKGYKAAGAYVNGVLVEEPGGGVCQVSSTMYNAVVFSGLTTTERNAHSYEPSYITPGEDAMVSYDGFAGPDMKFINNSKDAIAIRAKFSEQKLTISIVGIPILEAGEKWYMKSEKTMVLDPPEPVYEENQTLEPDVEKIVKQPVNGSRWVTNLVKEKNGTVVSDEFLHKSTYRGKAATIQRNTSGVVVPEPSDGVIPSDGIIEPSNEPSSPTSPTSPSAPTTGETTQSTEAGDLQGPGISTEAPTRAPIEGPIPEPGGTPTAPEPGHNDIAPNPFS